MNDLWNDIVKKLLDKKLTIAIMESCTGGGVANNITNVPGASTVFQEGYVTYSNEAKIKLGVSEDILKSYTVYSKETSIEMARVAKKIAKSDYSIRSYTENFGRIDPKNSVDKLNHVWYTIANNNNQFITKEICVSAASREEQKEEVIKNIGTDLLKII